MTIYTTMESPVGELLLVGQEADRGVALSSVTMAGQRYAPDVRAGGVERKQQLLVHEGALLGVAW